MNNLLRKMSVGGAGLALAVSGIVSFSPTAFAMSTSSVQDPSTYSVRLRELNHSGVKGDGELTLVDQQPGAELMATLDAWNTEPNQIHAIHIHGSVDGNNAECPTKSADTDGDKIVSVFEGAPFYGPIKVSFTSPATTFGPPSRTDLFAPFAGIPLATNFPKSNADGDVTYNQTIPFDQTNHFATEALASLTPLSDQHVVIHGGYAPESVDTPGGDPNKIVYDSLLPIACGQIVQDHQGSTTTKDESKGDDDQNAQGGNGESAMVGDMGRESGNVTNVKVANNVKQTASSGNATVKNGASRKSGAVSSVASSGNATNNFFSTIIINILNWGGLRHQSN